MQNNQRQVLMLEEDTDDRYLTQDTLREAGIEQPIRFFNNGDELFAFLDTAGPPSLILIDYNSGRETGIEVLKKLKAHPGHRHHPVVILSDSIHPRYVRECYAHGASSFIKKPDNMEETRTRIETFFRYWLQVAEL